MTKREKIVVAMSGGVDSSVAAALLHEQGHEVVGITLQIWQESSCDTKGAGCCSLGAVEDARRVATRIGIPFYVLNYREPFAEKVIAPFIDDYRNGRTPNPCINCNRYIKFDALMDKTLALGADALATGHYAQIFTDPATGRSVLKQAEAGPKDQTYALYATKQNELARMRMPLGDLPSKDVTRELARKYGLSVAEKPDSQEICFVQGGSYTDFLAQNAPDVVSPGAIVDTDGKVLGKHDGSAFYTVGQRRRINVGSAIPLYVVGVDAQSNTVRVGREEQLYSPGALVDDLNWVSMNEPKIGEEIRCFAKIRYNMAALPGTFIRRDENTLELRYDAPVRAVAPGQAAVFYGIHDRAGQVLGGGRICSPLRENKE